MEKELSPLLLLDSSDGDQQSICPGAPIWKACQGQLGAWPVIASPNKCPAERPAVCRCASAARLASGKLTGKRWAYLATFTFSQQIWVGIPFAHSIRCEVEFSLNQAPTQELVFKAFFHSPGELGRGKDDNSSFEQQQQWQHRWKEKSQLRWAPWRVI